MAKANINNYEGEICAFCQNWQGDADPRPDRSNPSIYEFDRGAEGKCVCTRTIKSAYMHCSCGEFARDFRIR